MKLAHIILRIDRVGNTVRRNYVTPAQVMVYVAEHRANCGTDPIVSIDEVAPEQVTKLLKNAKAEVADLNERIKAIEAEPNLMLDIKEKRIAEIEERIRRAEARIDEVRGYLSMFDMNASDEKRRLTGIFGAKKIKDLLAGNIPTLPETFEQARSIGIVSVTHSEHLVTIGDAGPGH